MENTPDAILRVDRGFRLLYANRAFEQFTGRPLASVLGERLDTPPGFGGRLETARRLQERLAQVFAGESVEPLEFTDDWPEGPRFFQTHIVPEPNERGDTEHALLIVRDLTETRRVEQERWESEERLRLAAESANFGTYDADLTTGHLHWSPRMKALFGLPADAPTPVPGTVPDFVHPEDVGRVKEMFKAAFDPMRNGIVEHEHRIIRTDGEVRWILFRGRVLFEGEGPQRHAVRSTGIVLDITERKRTEQEHQESERRFRSVLNNSRDIAYRRNLLTDRCEYLSPAIERITGYPAAEIAGFSLNELTRLIHPDDQPLFLSAVESSMHHGQGRIEYRFRSRTGEYLWLEDYVTVEKDPAGRPLWVVGVARDITERKRAVEQLQRNHETFHYLIQNNPFGMYIVDSDFRLCQVSLGARKIFRTIHPLLERNFEEVLHLLWPESFASKAIAVFRKTLETGEPYASATTVERRADTGVMESYDWRVERITLPDGRFGVVCNFYDLSERERWETALRRSEQTLQLALNAAELGTWAYSIEDKVAELDARARLLYGLPSPHFTFDKHAILQFWHPDEAETMQRELANALDPRGDGRYRLVHRVKQPDGTYRWLSAWGRTEFAGEGAERRATRIVGVTRDITNDKQAEEERNRLSVQRQLALDAAHLGWWHYDPETKIASFDSRYGEIFQIGGTRCPNEEILLTRVHPEDLPEVRRSMDAALDPVEPKPFAAEYRIMLPDGNIRWVEAYGMAVFEHGNGGQRATSLVGTVCDITEQKMTELALQHAKEQAEAANRAKSDFLAHMSHEIRTPIAGIVGMTDLLAARVTNPEQREYLTLVRESANSLLAVIGDVLDLSRIESGVVEVELDAWEVRKGVNTVVSAFRMAAERKNLGLVVHVDPAVPEVVRCDGEKISQVLRNLVSNAVKYTERGAVTVSVTRNGGPPENVRLRFAVQDTGVGIPASKRQSIFESFVRLRKSVAERNVEGTGLGLTITKRLAQMMGAEIEVRSEPGRGSTFTLTLEVEPLARSEVAPPQTQVSTLTSLPPLSILVVEDNRVNQMFLELSLKEAGHQVTVAAHGAEALAALERSSAPPL